MGKFGNTSLIIDAEIRQEVKQLMIGSFNLSIYSALLKKASEELGDRAIELGLDEGIDLEQLLTEIKKEGEP